MVLFREQPQHIGIFRRYRNSLVLISYRKVNQSILPALAHRSESYISPVNTILRIIFDGDL